MADTDKQFKEFLEAFKESIDFEQYFQEAFLKTMEFKDVHADQIEFNWKTRRQGKLIELDIVLIGVSKVLIVGVKKKPHTKDLQQLLTQKENFPIVFDDYTDHHIDLVLAGRYFYPELIEEAKAFHISLIQPKNNSIELVV